MAKKVSNFSDLIQRVTASCLLHPLGSSRFPMTPDHHFLYNTDTQNQNDLLKSKLDFDNNNINDPDYQNYCSSCNTDDDDDEDEDEEREKESGEIFEDATENHGYVGGGGVGDEREISGGGGGEVGLVLEEVFDAVSAMKRAYGKLQDAHSPFDMEKMRVADGEVVAELRRIAVLRERFRRCGRVRERRRVMAETVEEVVAPYEAVVEELKREVKVKESELDELRRKVCVLSYENSGGKKNKGNVGRSLSKKNLVLSQVSATPTPEMFEGTMSQVRETSKSFTSHLLSLMRSAHWDISAAVRSIEAAISSTGSTTIATTNPHQPKHALESYILRKIFQGFDHETFYMDGTLSSLLNPSQYRKECFSKFRDMKSMDPSELLGILPNSPFGVFCSKKYQDIVHPKMEESLFGNLDQRNQLFSGTHPRTQFYSEFLGLAKSVWLLHLLAFSLDPPPSHFEATRGAEFHPDYMETVVRFPGGNVPPGQIVGFPVSPGFKLGNGSIVKARVYLVPKS